MDANEGPLFHADPNAPETVLWKGQPGQMFPVIISPGGLFTMVVISFIVVLIVTGTAFHPVWFGSLPVLLTLYVLTKRRRALRIRKKRSSMIYMLTSRRVVRYSGADQRIVHSTRLGQLMDVTLIAREDGTGTIMCRPIGDGTWPTRNPKGRRRALFRQISDVETVYRLLQQAMASVTPDELTPLDRQRIALDRLEDGTSNHRWQTYSLDEPWRRTPVSQRSEELED